MAITTLRPTGTAKQVSIVGVGGGVTPHGSTSDNNDTTGMTGSVNNAYTWMDLGTTTIGAGNRIRSAQIRARIAHDGVDIGHNEYAQFRLRDPGAAGSASIFGPSTQFFTINGTGVVARGPFTSFPAPGGGAWSQAILDRIQMEVKFFDSAGSGLTFLTIREVYLDVDIVAQPVTSAVTVSAFTSGTKAQVDWTFTQAEYSQSAFRVFIYSQTQYSATNFVAGSSTATYDSGIVSSSDTTHIITSNLQNGITYRAYVQTAIDWPGPEGKLWWSSLVAMTSPGAQFTVAITPPGPPVLTATAQPALPGFRMLLNISASLNLLTENQSSLETDTTGLAAVNNCAISRVTTWSAHGAASLQLSSSAAGNMSAANSTRPRVKAGARVVGVIAGRSVAAVRSVRLDLRFFDIAGALIGSAVLGTAANDATGADTLWYVTGIAPANTYSADILVNVLATAGAAEQHRFDKWGIFHYATDPGTAAAAMALWTLGGYASTATLEISKSERVSDTITRGRTSGHMHPQIFSGGALIQGTDGFYARQASDYLRQLVLDRASPEGPEQTTAGMIEWTMNTAVVSALDIGMPNSAATGIFQDGQQPYAFPVQPGRTYSFSLWLWAAAAWSSKLYITWTDAIGTVLSNVAGSPLSVTTTEQKFTVSGTAPAGAVYALTTIENSAGTSGNIAYFTMSRWRPTDEPDEVYPGQVFAFVWKPVRANSTFTIPDGQASVNVYDHEAAPGRPVIYRARILATTSSGFAVASDPSTLVHVNMPYPAYTVLKDPFQPENAMRAWRIEDTTQQDEGYTIYRPRGASRAPVKTSDWIGGEDGQLQVSCLNQLHLYRLRQLLPVAASPLLVQWREGGQSYILATARNVEEIRVGGPYIVTLSYVETTRP